MGREVGVGWGVHGGGLAIERAACGESIRNTGVLVKPVGRPSQ